VSVVAAVLLQKVGDEPVRDLSVEHKITNHVILTDQGGGILAKVVKDLHYVIRLKDFSETVLERIHARQIDNVGLTSIVNLQELHGVTLGKAFAVHAEDRRLLLLDSVHDLLGQVSDFARLRKNIKVVLGGCDSAKSLL